MRLNLSKIIIFSISGLWFLTFIACKKDSNQSLIPYATVNVTLSVTPDLAKLVTGQAMICPKQEQEGDSGIIIYKDMDDYGNPVYRAYERLCTNYPNDTAAVTLATALTATCPRCGSQFEMTMGSVIKGPAKFALKQYRTTINGNRLYITN
jgi:Rieske Fe-S protein